MSVNLNEQKKASFWYLIANIMQKGAYLILIPLYTRVLSVDDYGVYTVSDSWLEILLVIISLNLFQNAYSVAVKKYNDRTGVSSAFCGVTILCVSVGMIVIFLGRDFFCTLFRVDFKILFAFYIYLLSNPIFMIWCTMKRYHYEYRELIIATFVKCFMIVGFGAIILLIDDNQVEFAIYAKAFAELFVAVYAILDICKKNNELYNAKYWKFAIKMGVPLIPYYLSLRILQHLDRIMISHIEGSDAAAKYGLIYKVTSAVMMINSSLNNAFLPWLYASYNEKNKKKINQVYVKLVWLIYSINALLSIIAPEIVRLLGTNEYYDAVYIMTPLSMSAVFIFVYDQCVNIELYYECNKVNSVFAVFISLLNALLNIFFINRYGYVAAGYTTLFSYMIYMLLHLSYMDVLSRRKHAIKIFKLSDIIIFFSMCVITVVLTPISYKCLPIRYGLFGIVLLIFMCALRKMNLKSVLVKNKGEK